MKLRSLTLVVSLLTGISTSTFSSDYEVVDVTPIESSLYINANFPEFIKSYNEDFNLLCQATYVEDLFEITIDTYNEKYTGYFLDFNDSNGYAVVGSNYTLYDLQIEGASPFLGIHSSEYYYSSACGYLYSDGNELINVDSNKNTPKSYLDTFEFSTASNFNSVDNQTNKDIGHIYDLDRYMYDAYDSKYEVFKKRSLKMSTDIYSQQWYLSVYQTNKYEDGKYLISSEGNCWFVSAYNILQSMADATYSYKEEIDKYKTDSSKPDMPITKDIIEYNPRVSEPNLFSKVYDENGNNVSGILKTENGQITYNKELMDNNEVFKFPVLYTEVRKYVDKNNKTVDSGTIYKTSEIINEIGKLYGYDFESFGTVLFGVYGMHGFDAIDRNHPFALCVASVSNAGYGNHIMAGCGYVIYKKTESWLNFTKKSYAFFYELRNGHDEKEVYFDYSKFSGFGGIALLNW